MVVKHLKRLKKADSERSQKTAFEPDAAVVHLKFDLLWACFSACGRLLPFVTRSYESEAGANSVIASRERWAQDYHKAECTLFARSWLLS